MQGGVSSIEPVEDPLDIIPRGPEGEADEDAVFHWFSGEEQLARYERRVAAAQATIATWSEAEIVRAARHRLLQDEIKVWLTFYSEPDIVEIDDAGHNRIDLVPTCLYGAAWRQLTDAVGGQRQWRQCRHCPRSFEVAPDVARNITSSTAVKPAARPPTASPRRTPLARIASLHVRRAGASRWAGLRHSV